MSESQPFGDTEDLQFPIITISVSSDDLEEPIHVDLGSVPPFIAAAVLEKVALILKTTIPAPKITFKGNVLVEPINGSMMVIENLFDAFMDDDEDDQEDE